MHSKTHTIIVFLAARSLTEHILQLVNILQKHKPGLILLVGGICDLRYEGDHLGLMTSIAMMSFSCGWRSMEASCKCCTVMSTICKFSHVQMLHFCSALLAGGRRARQPSCWLS